MPKHDVFLRSSKEGIKLFIDGMLDDIFESMDELIDSIRVLQCTGRYDCTYVNVQLKKLRSL